MCSLDWLKARQYYLCASDVKKLLPVTNTGRARKVTDEDYVKVYSSKIKDLTEDDCISTGAAARGHMLEPYAIQEFNKKFPNDILYHWDDCVVNTGRKYLAYSPDAMNIERPKACYTICTETPENITIGEIKSYSPEHHLVACNKMEDELEERWQIATAMAADPNIVKAYLVFFNPALKKFALDIKRYHRDDLKEEISIVDDIEKSWDNFLANMNHVNLGYQRLITEEEIIKDIENKQRLNPCK